MATGSFNVLLIEDNPGDVRLIRAMLAGTQGTACHLECADRLSTGLERLAGPGIDVVLLDFMLPDSQGLETFSRVHARAPGVPVVVLTGLGDETVAVKAVQAGAQDYLVKGQVDGNLLVRSLRYAIERQRNITEREQLERQFRQAQKMEAVGRLAGGIAHDFNNMLEVVVGYSHLLLADTNPEDPRREGLEVIQEVSERAGQLTRQLLVFSRRQVPAPRVLDLNDIVANMKHMLQRLIGESIKLETVLDPCLALVKADAGQLEQVIMNLVVNARDAMPDGGRLTLETANLDPEAPLTPPCPSAPSASDCVMLAVRDTGCGMDAETQSHLFEPFFTTKAPGEGTGLGLATVYGIVQQSGGYIGVASELGCGTTFKIYLPRTEAVVPSLSVTDTPGGLPAGSEMVLLVEDDPRVRRLVREMLRRSGYGVLEAGKAEEAARICGQYEGSIHLLLTDVVMPEMGGHEVAQRVADLRPEIKVLYMSGSPEVVNTLRDRLGAGTAILPKPFTPAVLALRVREVLGEER